ncbi:MAG: PGPGW domain-containing protein [Nitriliruptoraceae bacterium]
MGPVGRLRERLVLGELRTQLAADERVVSWAHAQVPGVRAPAVLVVTDQRCLVHVASVRSPDTHAPLGSLVRFDLDQDSPDRVRVRLNGAGEELVVELSLATRARSRAVGRVLTALTRRNIGAPETFDPSKTSPLPPVPRGMKDHARRVWVTVVGVVVLLLSLAFASPFLPGPGALTAVAGIAILAREYEWARDVHVWANRQAERFVAWARDLVVRARAGSRRHVGAVDGHQDAGRIGLADADDTYREAG